MNSTATPLDRAFAALSYVMPLASALGAGIYFLPFLQQAAPPIYAALYFVLYQTPLSILIAIENSIFGIVVFFVLFLFVIRNQDISRFIRFNVLQAIIVSFSISIGTYILSLIGVIQIPVVGEALLNVLFLGGMAIVIYGVAFSVLGRYTEVPGISDAVNAQMPF